MSDKVLINGNQHSWPSVDYKIGGSQYWGFTSISWDNKRERTLLYGMGKAHAPRGITSGKYTPGVVKISAWKSTAQEIRQQYADASPSGKSYGDSKLTHVLQYTEADDTPQTVVFELAFLTSESGSSEEGTDGAKEDLEFQPMAITVNGLVLYRVEG